MSADPRFPQMADALNPEVMGPLLRRALSIPGLHPYADAAVGACSIGEKRYQPGKSLVISYRVASGDSSMSQAHLATARLCSPGKAHSEFQRERARRPDLIDGALGFLHEPAMLLWRFPHDRKLVYLPRLLDAAALRTLLAPKVTAMGVDPAHSILSESSEVLHYLPERSCMIRYRVDYRNAFTGASNTVFLYAKHYADDTGAEVFAIMQQLGGQFASGAQALAYDTELRTLWQSHVPGTPLSWADLDSSDGLAVAAVVGRCVAELHGCSITTQARFTRSGVEQGLVQTIQIAERTRPALGGHIRRAVAALSASGQPRSESVATPIHHDLKLNNFLIDGGSIGLIDLDSVCLGDPMADLASLIANLYLNGLREGQIPGRIDPLAGAIVRAYREASLHTVSLRRLYWHIAAALIYEVTRRSLRQLDDRRMEHIEAYLDLSETYAALSRGPESEADEFS